MDALITGADGFVGRHLIAELASAGYRVAALCLGAPQPPLPPDVALVTADVTSPAAVAAALRAVRPSVIFHLAALTDPGASFHNTDAVHAVNVGGTENLLRAAADAGLRPTVLLAGSAYEYGVPAALPVREDAPLRPTSPYGASKAAAEEVGRRYADRLDVVMARSFNHTGPGQGLPFVVPALARQVARIERGEQEPRLLAGNLESRRDFLDVRDVVRAYRLLVERGRSGEAYNVASGTAVTIGHIVDLLLERSTAHIEVVRDPARLKPGEIPVLVGDNTKLRAATGWQPTIPIEQTVDDVLDYWRAKP